jgi:hypothetical protein
VIVKEALGDVQEARGRHADALQRHLERAQRRLVAAGLLRGDDPVERDAEPPVRAGEQGIVAIGDEASLKRRASRARAPGVSGKAGQSPTEVAKRSSSSGDGVNRYSAPRSRRAVASTAR